MSTPIDPQTLEDLRCGYWELVGARPGYERAAAFYEGTVDEVYSSPKVTRLLAKFGLDAIESFNFAHIPVDAVANKLILNNVNADEENSEEGEITENNEINDVIEDLWDYNELEEVLPGIFRDTGKYGDSYVMVWPVIGDEEDNSVSRGFDPYESAKQLETGDTLTTDDEIASEVVSTKSIVGVDILPLDPLTTRVFYDVENPRKKTYAIRSWVEGEGNFLVIRVNLYYADRIERWMHKGKPSKRKNAQNKWEPFTQDGNPAVLVNPFGEVPIFHFRTDRTYGRPDHINAYGPQLAINKLVTSHLATVDYQSFPQRYALLDPMADQSGLNGADSDPFAPEDADNDPDDDDNQSQLEADPAAVWQFSGMKTVGQFESANADAFLKPFDRYVKALAQATDTPFHYFDRTGERPPSGENIRQVNEFLNKKAGFRQTGYGSEVKKFTTLALTMMGHDVERINVEWEPLETVNSFVEWQAVNEKIAAGVPEEVALIEAGYRPALVMAWKKQKEEAAKQEFEQALEQQAMTLKMQHENQPTPDVRYAEHNPPKPIAPATKYSAPKK